MICPENCIYLLRPLQMSKCTQNNYIIKAMSTDTLIGLLQRNQLDLICIIQIETIIKVILHYSWVHTIITM